MKLLHTIALVAATLLSAPTVFAQVSDTQIQTFKDVWSNTRMLRGRFIETHADGHRQQGQFLIQSPSVMVMQYQNGTKVTVNSGNVSIEEPGRQTINQSAGPLSRLFRENPNIDGLITGGGTGTSETKLRLRHPTNHNRGYVDLVFDNPTARLTGWVNQFDGNDINIKLIYQ